MLLQKIQCFFNPLAPQKCLHLRHISFAGWDWYLLSRHDLQELNEELSIPQVCVQVLNVKMVYLLQNFSKNLILIERHDCKLESHPDTYRNPVRVGFLLYCVCLLPRLQALFLNRDLCPSPRTQVQLSLGYIFTTRAPSL